MNWYSFLSFEVWEAQLPPDLQKQISDALDRSERSPESRVSLFRASRAELEHGILEHDPYHGKRIGDNSWALDKGIALPKGWWRD